jgi:hypothetical protein
MRYSPHSDSSIFGSDGPPSIGPLRQRLNNAGHYDRRSSTPYSGLQNLHGSSPLVNGGSAAPSSVYGSQYGHGYGFTPLASHSASGMGAVHRSAPGCNGSGALSHPSVNALSMQSFPRTETPNSAGSRSSYYPTSAQSHGTLSSHGSQLLPPPALGFDRPSSIEQAVVVSRISQVLPSLRGEPQKFSKTADFLNKVSNIVAADIWWTSNYPGSRLPVCLVGQKIGQLTVDWPTPVMETQRRYASGPSLFGLSRGPRAAGAFGMYIDGDIVASEPRCFQHACHLYNIDCRLLDHFLSNREPMLLDVSARTSYTCPHPQGLAQLILLTPRPPLSRGAAWWL